MVEFRPADLQLFLALRTADLIDRVADVPRPNDLGEPAADLRPSTPPAQLFQIGPRVRSLVEAGLAKSFRGGEYMRAAGSLDEHVQAVQKRLCDRRDAVHTAINSPGTLKESVDHLISQILHVVDDFGTVNAALGAVSGLCRGIYYTLEATLPTGNHWGALTEMLEIMDRMRTLVGSYQEKLEQLEGSQDPLRDEVKRIADLCESVRAEAIAMPGLCSRSVEPMLIALNNTLAQAMSDTRNAVASPLERIVEVLERDGQLSTDDAEQLGELITAALRTLFGAADSGHTFDSLAGAVAELEERVAELEDQEDGSEAGTGSGTDGEEVRMSREFGSTSPRAALAAESLHRGVASSHNPVQQLTAAVESLTTRVQALERAECERQPLAAAIDE